MSDRESLAEIRATGKNSRGGKGSRRRRNPSRVPARRLSAAEQNRRNVALHQLAIEAAGLFVAGVYEDAVNVLAGIVGLSPDDAPTPASFWRSLGEGQRFNLMPEGDRLHRQGLIFAYSLFTVIASSEEFDQHVAMVVEWDAVLAKAAGKPGKSVTIKTLNDLLRLVARFTLRNYQEKYQDTQVWRLSAAIRFLVANGVGPHQVESFHREHGGGLDDWSRAAPKILGRTSKEAALETAVLADDKMTQVSTAYYEDDRATQDSSVIVPPFDNILLRQAVISEKLAKGDFILVGIVADSTNNFGAKIVLKEHFEDIRLTPELGDRSMSVLASFAKNLLLRQAPQGPYDRDGWIRPEVT